ncbi:hypothetical protein GYMLUDRAFT_752985 [Collybiopsis luxurians FD-317 M1]|uniref:Uncharacterized protein n=1 Tax=Collybiopsis luxurians FD-317 M1 TaxID=944289 RepID=A0A0D0C558_9AGAR|nr:hypothetical protein GYMLUDRAFT_752985 [Collybiopsis luxurians FD-317 M1]
MMHLRHELDFPTGLKASQKVLRLRESRRDTAACSTLVQPPSSAANYAAPARTSQPPTTINPSYSIKILLSQLLNSTTYGHR